MGRAKQKDTMLASVLALLKSAGATVDSIQQRNHIKVKWSFKGKKFIIIVCKTESDHRSEKNTLAQVKRNLREMGHEV